MPILTTPGLAPADDALDVEKHYKPTFGEYLKAVWDDTANDDPMTLGANLRREQEARYGVDVYEVAEEGGLTGGLEALRETAPLPAMPLEEQKAYINKEGLAGQLAPGEHYTPEELEFLARLKHEELDRKLTREQAPGWMAPFGFAAGLAESMTDPLNLATSFVPVVGEARLMSLLGKTGSAWGRAGVRAGVGAIEGAVGAALVEPVVAGAKSSLQQEYGFADSLMNVAFGAGMGAALHPLTGAFGDFTRARKGQRQPWEYVASTDKTEQLRAGNAQSIWRGMQESGSEHLSPEHAEAAAALWDATLRGYAYDTGELVEDLYRHYRVEYRGGKLEVLPTAAEADGRTARLAEMFKDMTDTTERTSVPDGDEDEARPAAPAGENAAQLEQAMYRSKSKSLEEFIKEVRSGEITYRAGERSPDAVKKFFGLDELVTNYPYYFIQHLDNRRSEATGSLLNMADDVLADADYIQETGQRKTGEKLYSAVRRNGDGTATLVVFELVKSRKKGNRILPHSAIIENENTIENVVRQKGRASTSTNAGSGPSLLKPLEEDELRVLEALFSKKLSQTGEKGKPLSQASTEGAQGALYQDGEQGTVITVRGDELGVPEGADIREYRKAAREVYRELQKTPAHREDLGDIRFSGDGFRKMQQAGADKRKWQLVPKLKELIESAEYVRRNDLYKVRRDGIVIFHWLETDVELNGQRLRVGFTIGEDLQGNKFYNLNHDVEAFKVKREEALAGHLAHNRGPQELPQGATAPITNTITTSTDGVNLYILSEGAQGEAPRARVTFGEQDAYAVVEFFKAADPSSAPHEMYHIFRRIMSELYDDPRASEASKERYRKACEFVGAEPGKVWTPEQEEKFARAGERFLLEGVAPNARMHDVMEAFRQWMGEIYGNAERSGLEISDGMRKVFGDMLGTAEDGDLNFRYAMGQLLDYHPERGIDTTFEAPAYSTPEQALEAYTADASARMDEAFNALADKPEVQEQFRQEYEAALADADAVIADARTMAQIRQAAAACVMRG